MTTSQKKTYFIMPSFDIAVGDPCLGLGSIITNPADPLGTCQNAGGSRVPPLEVRRHPQANFHRDVRRPQTVQGRLPLWPRFLQVATATTAAAVSAAVASATTATMEEESFRADELITETFDPTAEYVKSCLAAAPGVAALARRVGFCVGVYMVTGLKTARGVVASTRKVVQREVAVGVAGAFSTTTETSTGFESSEAIIYAYQLRQIKLRRGDEATTTEYNRGAMLGNEPPAGGASSEHKVEVELDGVGDHDLFAGELPGGDRWYLTEELWDETEEEFVRGEILRKTED